jgi:hypothetical protein
MGDEAEMHTPKSQSARQDAGQQGYQNGPVVPSIAVFGNPSRAEAASYRHDIEGNKDDAGHCSLILVIHRDCRYVGVSSGRRGMLNRRLGFIGGLP